jgi:hypothetical protein
VWERLVPDRELLAGIAVASREGEGRLERHAGRAVSREGAESLSRGSEVPSLEVSRRETELVSIDARRPASTQPR